MRWSIIQLIWFRELRDLLRDRRTLFMLLGLPVLLYPLFGVVGYVFAAKLLDQTSTIGIIGAERLPRLTPTNAATGPVAAVGWTALAGGQFADVGAGCALTLAHAQRADYPALLANEQFLLRYCDSLNQQKTLLIRHFPDDADPEKLLFERQADAVIRVPDDLNQPWPLPRPKISVQGREGDETSKLAVRRVRSVLGHWREHLKAVVFQRHGLTANFDDVLRLDDPEQAKPLLNRTADELRDVMAKFFPFLMVMWALAGALHPAIDLCAGEKERGTMETLLISPADRPEIVGGKFLAIWLYSSATALWNLLFMGGGLYLLGFYLPFQIINFSGLIWCGLLTLPLSALFSGICLALGVYARSTKEGQYYLMPLFMIVMPLIIMSMAPGIELNLGYSLVPVTGVALLLQKLLSVAPDPVGPWVYFPPVLLALAGFIWLALRWAVYQYRREDVLFREAEQVDPWAWLKRLVRPS